MDLSKRITECQTIDDLSFLETHYMLDDNERALVFERKVEIIGRLLEWGVENEGLGLPANLAETWRPEQREYFISQWKNDQPLLLANDDPELCDLTHNWSSYERDTLFGEWSNDEGLLQVGRGEKRHADDNYHAETSEVSNNNLFRISQVRQVKV